MPDLTEMAREYQLVGTNYTDKAIPTLDAMQGWMPEEHNAGDLNGNCIKYIDCLQ